MLELTVFFLWSESAREFRFEAPGTGSHARWMSKIIYSIKMTLLSKQLTNKSIVDNQCAKKLYHFSVLTTHIYVQYWFKCPNAAGSPTNDINLK